MSHFIQDNQAIVKTNDGTYLLFIKGGDNNVFDHNNKRHSEWFFNKQFANKEAFETYLDAIITDVSGGGWQFQSLKNKELIGYYDYEAIVIERFRKALKNAVSVDFDIRELNTSNVIGFINHDPSTLFGTKNSHNPQIFYATFDFSSSHHLISTSIGDK